MDATFVAALEAKFELYTTKKNALEAAKSQLANAIANADELTRQYGVKNGEGDAYNANILEPQMYAARAEAERLGRVVNTLTAERDSAFTDYNNYKNSLSPAEQTIVTQTAQANIAQANASAAQLQAAADKAALENKEKIFAQDKSNTIFYIGIAVAVVVISCVLYAVFKKKRPAAND